MKHIKNNKGMTLVELIVSMGLFAIVITLLMSFFIVMQRLQMTYRDTANLQQEGRAASEIFARLAREAKTVKDGSDQPVTTQFSIGNGLCDGGSLVLTMADGDHTFTCDGTPKTLKMDSSEISSSQVNLQSLTISRGADLTYPRTLRYNMEFDKIGATGEGDKIMFPGYLVMRNEL